MKGANGICMATTDTVARPTPSRMSVRSRSAPIGPGTLHGFRRAALIRLVLLDAARLGWLEASALT
jgi:hypothetical protein